jgi:Fic family protein
VSVLLPDPGQFLYSYIRKEAVLSSQIEGTQSSLCDLLLFENEQAHGVPLDDVEETSNYIAAMSHGLERIESGKLPLGNRLLREVHKVLMSGAGGRQGPGRVPAQPELARRDPSGQRSLRTGTGDRGRAGDERSRAVPARRARADADSHQGSARACAVRDDPPFP